MNIFMFQNCSNWKGKVLVTDTSTAFSNDDFAPIQIDRPSAKPPETDAKTPVCQSGEERTFEPCPSGTVGTRTEVCFDGKYEVRGECSPITCAPLSSALDKDLTSIAFNQTFKASCGDGFEGFKTYKCVGPNELSELTEPENRTCLDTNGGNCRDGETLDVNCRDLYGSKFKGVFKKLCKADHKGFDLPPGFDLAKVCSEISCDNDGVAVGIGKTRDLSCDIGMDGIKTEECELDPVKQEAVFVTKKDSCEPVICQSGSKVATFGNTATFDCLPGQHGDGVTYSCSVDVDDAAIPGSLINKQGSFGAQPIQNSCLPDSCI
jgi:hypothetical protein